MVHHALDHGTASAFSFFGERVAPLLTTPHSPDCGSLPGEGQLIRLGRTVNWASLAVAVGGGDTKETARLCASGGVSSIVGAGGSSVTEVRGGAVKNTAGLLA